MAEAEPLVEADAAPSPWAVVGTGVMSLPLAFGF